MQLQRLEFWPNAPTRSVDGRPHWGEGRDTGPPVQKPLLTFTEPLQVRLGNLSSRNARLVVVVDPDRFHTYWLPGLPERVIEAMPSIIADGLVCHNPRHEPFSEEIKHTETGHLFEHVVLGYMLENDIYKGRSDVHLKATTSWNWDREPRGVFHLRFWGRDFRRVAFVSAVEQALALLNPLLAECQPLPFDLFDAA